MSRDTLPNRREIETFEFEHRGLFYFASVGLYHDGRIGEVFVQARKTSSLAEALARDSAILTSLAIQHGCDVRTMRLALTREEDGSPSTLTGALLDAIDPARPDEPVGMQGPVLGLAPAGEMAVAG